MPFTKPTPEWNKPGVEPPQSLKDSGFVAGSSPAAGHFDWLFYTISEAIQELQQNGYTQDEITQAISTAMKSYVESSDVVTSATANKLLKLDTNGKLPTSITGNADGNAATASKLASARTLSITGDGTASGSFDGSANLALSLVLAKSGATAGTYRSVTIDENGRVTAGTNPTTLSEYGITDAVALSDLENNFGESGYKGYQKLPGGLIMQWNLEQVSDSGTYVTFPVSFPHQLYTLVATPRSTTPGRVYVASFTKVNAELVNDISGGSLVFWIAIGS
ncbi:gp53-like domain-containing protein [Sporolactobacillus laevolacticus]|uniref:Putative tail fiber protein gp53-like C-terminal domain-containing protein n=1 Tax=Sporolactobacillus laevolacticus DSM 442 TaxID=1395513 RepID=V6IXX3_9BACL|nr:hypothetical protein [Sporolactobacillus laevolacticus]EST12217.1 hypothetical protein P343_07885 [Sporolactobacillus laevolacticus DSM 442]